jgi:hypothetical protein
MPEVLNTVLKLFSSDKILENHEHRTMPQLILDCSSLNLSSTTRIDPNHPDIFHVVRACPNMCYAIHAERIQKLKVL